MIIFGKSLEQKAKGRVHSHAKADVSICRDLRYLKGNDVIKWFLFSLGPLFRICSYKPVRYEFTFNY